MTTNIVSGLFGLSPYQVEQQQRQAINKQAYDFANMPAVQRGVMGMYQGGAGLADIGAGMLGLENPAVREAKMREQALSGLDPNNPQSILERAAQIQDPRLKMELTLFARQQMADQQKQRSEASTIKLNEARAEKELALAEKAMRENPNLTTAEVGIEGRPGWTQMILYDKTNPNAKQIPIGAPKQSAAAMRIEVGGRGGGQGKAPSGYMWNADGTSLVAIPGGPADKGQKLTKGQEAVDREFGKEYADYVASGGFADVNKQLTQLRQVANELEKPNNDYTGPAVGLIPEKARAFTNPAAVDAKNKVEEVAQRNLRLVLGAQFTQVEGERLIARAYNPSLEPKDNAARVRALIQQIETAAKTKEDAARYFEENGTLTGWKGKMPSITDFEEAIDKATPSRSASGSIKQKNNVESGAPSGVDPKVWAVMTPQEKALWQK